MEQHAIVVIGAGPVGLAAAAHARARGTDVVVLEAGPTAGAAVADWGHVRLFSPWSQLVDPVAATLLASTGWHQPDPDGYPTGADWVRDYLRPLADALGPDVVRLGRRVTGVARQGRDLVVGAGRDDVPFVVHVHAVDGEQRLLADAVIDASGTWSRANPLGADGLPAVGERSHADRITYRVPDLAEPEVAARFAGRHVAVAGTGASAMTVLVGLAALAEEHPATRISWLVRRAGTGDTFGGGDRDQLAARGALGRRARQAVESGLVTTRTGFRTVAVRPGSAADPGGALTVESLDGQRVDAVDEVVVVTGFRPDVSFLSEVRLDLDPALQSTRALAPLVDPTVHSCGTVHPHGAAELAQPESGLYLAGMKSYGRAPSFLALTGFEQVRSVVAAIDGDHDAAARVELTLPDSGVCGGSGLFDEAEPAAGGCCTSPVTDELLTLGSRVEA
jgi:thioredoxin reductase